MRKRIQNGKHKIASRALEGMSASEWARIFTPVSIMAKPLKLGWCRSESLSALGAQSHPAKLRARLWKPLTSGPLTLSHSTLILKT